MVNNERGGISKIPCREEEFRFRKKEKEMAGASQSASFEARSKTFRMKEWIKSPEAKQFK